MSMTVARNAGSSLRTGIRWLFLLVLNITPGGIGTWRREFSRRETALAACFLAFVVVLIAFVAFSR